MKLNSNFWIFVLLFSIVGIIACIFGVIVSLVNDVALFAGSLALAALFGILICLSVNRV
jgi:hypothetical protein